MTLPVVIRFVVINGELESVINMLRKFNAFEISMTLTPGVGWKFVASFREIGPIGLKNLKRNLSGTVWLDDAVTEADVLQNAAPPEREVLLQKLGALLANAKLPTARMDYYFSLIVYRLVASLRQYLATNPIDERLMDDVVGVVMGSRRLFIVEGPDGKRSIRQHLACPSAPRHEH
jgi:hypothetical protein